LLGLFELQTQGHGQTDGGGALPIGKQHHARVPLSRGHGEPSHDVGPSEQRKKHGATGDALGIDDQHGKDVTEGHAHGGSGEGMRRGIHDEEPFEHDAVGGDPGSVQGSGGVEPGTPSRIAATQQGFSLSGGACVQSEGRGKAAPMAGELHDGTSRQAAIGQGGSEGWQGQDPFLLLENGWGAGLWDEVRRDGDSHRLNIRSAFVSCQSILISPLPSADICGNVPRPPQCRENTMKMNHLTRFLLGFGAWMALASCDPPTAKPSPTPSPSASAPKVVAYDALDRATFNRVAVQMDLPVFWIEDKNANKAIDPEEVASLLFYPTQGNWVDGDRFTARFEEVYKQIQAWAKSPTFPKDLPDAEKKRRMLVIEELDQGQPTLVFSNFTKSPPQDKVFVRHMLAAAKLIDDLHGQQRGLAPLAAQIPKDDPSGHAAFRRNWGPKCGAPKTEKNPACSAIATSPEKVLVAMYPEDVQKEEGFCDKLAKHADGEKLMSPFVVVKNDGDKLVPEPITVTFKDLAEKVSKELRMAADSLDGGEAPFKAYLQAAAQAFLDNRWEPADEAWAKLNATNSKWYLRIGPDEVYWEPCSRKAGFHMSFARINEASVTWQKKLEPVRQQMEDDLAKHIGAPYKARKVSFHLPDFIDIVANAGDSRHPLGATIGQSLPNWGPVANEGRGRTVVMSNLYTDPDSLLIRKEQAESMLDAATAGKRSGGQDPSLLATILHEAMHNFGPSHEYKVQGKTDDQHFGGPLASTMEELKAQTGALWFVALLKKQGIIDATLAEQTYVDSILWALNHIARGMYTDDGKPKTYSHVSAIQVGFLLEEGALTFDPAAPAANGKDKGAFTLHFDKFPAAFDKMMKVAGGIKAKGDRKQAEELVKKFVDGDTVPMAVIAERSLRHPKAAFVYGLSL
jgi:hypothetical protein